MPAPAAKLSRATARLAAVQALYQREMAGTPLPHLLSEFHTYRLGEQVGEVALSPPDATFFQDVVAGTDARGAEIDALIAENLASGWMLDRLDRPMRAILRAGAYELLARPDVSIGTAISEYVNVAHAFYERREAGFVNGVLDAIAKKVRKAA